MLRITVHLSVNRIGFGAYHQVYKCICKFMIEHEQHWTFNKNGDDCILWLWVLLWYLCVLRDFLCIFIFNHIIVKTSIDINDKSAGRWIHPQHMKTSPLSYSLWRWYPLADVGITYSPNRNDNIISYTWTNGYFLTVVISHFINGNVRFNQPKSLTV